MNNNNIKTKTSRYFDENKASLLKNTAFNTIILYPEIFTESFLRSLDLLLINAKYSSICTGPKDS